VLCGIAEGLPNNVFGLTGNDLCQYGPDVCVTTHSQARAHQVLDAEHSEVDTADSTVSSNANYTQEAQLSQRGHAMPRVVEYFG